MPLVQTRGAASAQGFGEFAQATTVNYIEDVFSCFLYTGNGSTQTITNGIDLAGKGGLVWFKKRNNASDHIAADTIRGVNQLIQFNTTQASANRPDSVTAFNSNGFSLGTETDTNASVPFVSWTFRKQPKFFDVVTYTGDGNNNRLISHNLGSIPACVIVKNISGANPWPVYHRSLTSTQYSVFLNTTASQGNAQINQSFSFDGSVSMSSTKFVVSQESGYANSSAVSYVAYLFAHDAGGFGLTGADNVISCASYTGNGSNTGPIINLGYEPQWIMIKSADTASSEDWHIVDNARALSSFDNPTNNTAFLRPNLTAIETASCRVKILSNGFQITVNSAAFNESGKNYIYVAIRRGPMKVPTDATKVFGMSARSGTGANATVTGGQTDDAVLVKNRGSAVASLFASRLTGTGYLVTSSTAAEVAAGVTILQANPWDVMDGVKVGTTSTITNATSNTYINYLFKRAPSFMDVVCYTGTGGAGTFTHNLGVVPEFMIVKRRSAADDWAVYHNALTASNVLQLNSTIASTAYAGYWNNTAPTSSVFTTGAVSNVNGSGSTYVAYLFATCAGVSKVGSYTGTGTTLQINCGFTAGARFVLIKRTDSTGDWYVWDSARGIVAGNDPYLLLNSTAAEVTGTDYVDTYSAGFEISSTAPAAINASAGTFVFLAVA